MKSILLASAGILVDLAVITTLFGTTTVKNRVGAMIWVFLVTVPIFIAVHLLTPYDLWVLPGQFVERARAVDVIFGLLVFAAAFFGGILQVYNLADRGFSLRILIELHESPRGVMTAAEIARTYSGGRGLRWMYEKRISDLVEQRIVTIKNGIVQSSTRGERAAAVFSRLRALFSVPPDA